MEGTAGLRGLTPYHERVLAIAEAALRGGHFFIGPRVADADPITSAKDLLRFAVAVVNGATALPDRVRVEFSRVDYPDPDDALRAAAVAARDAGFARLCFQCLAGFDELTCPRCGISANEVTTDGR